MKMLKMLLVMSLSFALIACSPQQATLSSQTSEEQPLKDSQLSTDNEVESPPCSYSLGFDIWEPYQYINVDGEVSGVDIQIITGVINEMGCTVSYVQGTWVSLLEDLRLGNVDMLIGASKTPAREEFAYFSAPYRTEQFSLYIRNDDKKRAAYNDIDEFIANGSKIGVVGDYYYGPQITILQDSKASSSNFVSGIMGELNIARLLDMDIDGFLEDSFVGASILRRKGLDNYIVEHGFTVTTGDIYVMFSQSSVAEADVQKFNSALDDYMQMDSYKHTLQKYSR
ncbi:MULTISPECIES: substrate-binding periplasmic protein [Aliiglaciecola]|uniref:substrate-binding periplasmic protein n=1 Tax=Aliiglaciecola TaxID=1406885 RepID=UPI001C095EFA|nr:MULTISPECIES: transporter substrate-binding domain-containing protein [Aliiglaciecola]MBU2876056.1 transporter substrate-binding domain-containing protein [Aliiglaciecola lipolytica]MDO6713140.1 transporter substrate-binding domain-containing protein [Aliiglaciecola sp. 2_MG-2023]MDO6754186.1 transporter substrate-binding domain-containing protein [Aliiglaciecola sp. 1_MG-2023]